MQNPLDVEKRFIEMSAEETHAAARDALRKMMAHDASFEEKTAGIFGASLRNAEVPAVSLTVNLEAFGKAIEQSRQFTELLEKEIKKNTPKHTRAPKAFVLGSNGLVQYDVRVGGPGSETEYERSSRERYWRSLGKKIRKGARV